MGKSGGGEEWGSRLLLGGVGGRRYNWEGGRDGKSVCVGGMVEELLDVEG